jgi:hypothetical protein
VRGEICSICCGTEREVTVDCPFDCVYLQEARRHEKPPATEPGAQPNPDITLKESFLRDNEGLLIVLSHGVLRGALETPGIIDNDVREALDSLVRTYRTLQSGVYYETRPANPLANFVFQAVQQAAADYRENERRHAGLAHTRDADVLGMLVFLRNVEQVYNNGRPRGRAFLDFLRIQFPLPEEAGRPPSLIVP